ncbi:autotransporter domain-containing protein [Anaerobiospirillum sp. NML120448]|uniref:autotransporter domain-containing protein n=1 Tax=Anaerobiospirillum sp. NML120448 TaxID=2932816 RepID=UPI001FF23420|nr:autotransporter domain-containing protein [Anaerobiospirillum sp. NML120448]MCK0515356.1 autotransporter domain-containing protein [Anaerobiospirillum sp. NML120448]
MKQTNNAIKFLMAQYRAIFQNAYFKGLATAAVVTMGLAVGQAQAGKVDQIFNGTTAVADGTIIINGVQQDDSGEIIKNQFTKITVTADPTADFSNKVFEITSGETSANTITGAAGANLSFKGKSLTVNISAGATHGLAISSAGTDNTKNAEVEFTDGITVTKGTISLAGSAQGTAGLASKEITLAGATTGDANITVGSLGFLGYDLAKKGAAATEPAPNVAKDVANYSDIEVGAHGKITATASTDNTNIQAANLSIKKDGELVVATGAKATDTATLTLVTGELAEGKITTVDSGGLTVKFADGDFVKSGDSVEKTLTLTKGKLNLGGELTLSGEGKLVISNLDALTFEGDKGVTLSGGASFAPANIAQANALAKKTPLSVAKGGILDFGSNSLDLTQTENVPKFGTPANKANGTIGLADGGIVKAKDMTLDADLGVDGAVAKADTITLKNKTGSNVTFSQTTISANSALNLDSSDVKISTAYGKIILGEDSAKTIAASEAYKKADADKKALLLGHAGSINSTNGTLTVSNAAELQVANGTWTSNANITLDKNTAAAKLTIGSANANSAAKLSLDGKTLTSKSGTITIGNGTTAPLYAELDLTGATIDHTDTSVTIEKNGVLKLTGEQAQELLTGSKSSAFKTLIKGGATLAVAGDLELEKADFTTQTGAQADAINLSGDSATNKATLKVDGSLTIKDANDFNVGANNKLVAQGLVLNSGDSVTPENVSLGAGEYVLNTLTSDFQKNGKALDATLGASANVKFGTISPKKAADGSSYSVQDLEEGSTNLNLVLSGATDTTKVEVLSKNWTGKNVTLTSGDFAIGDGTSKDIDGNILGSKAKFDNLVVTKADGKFTVHENSSATIKSLDLQAGSDSNFTVKGKLTVNGLQSEETDPAKITSLGLSTAAGSVIKVDGANAELTLGETVLSPIKFNANTGAVEYDTTKIKDDPFAGKIDLNNFATLSLKFADKTKFNTKELEGLRKEFFGSGDTLDDGFIYLGEGSTLVDANGNSLVTDGKISQDALASIGDIKDIKDDTLSNATVDVTDVSKPVVNNVGNIQTSGNAANATEVTVGYGSLNNAALGANKDQYAVNASGTSLNLKVEDGVNFGLNGGGVAGEIAIGNNAVVYTNSADPKKNVIAKVSGGDNTEFQVQSGTTEVKDIVKVGVLNTEANTNLVIGKTLTVSNATSDSEIKGNLEVADLATFKGNVSLDGQNNVFKNGLTAEKTLDVNGNVTVLEGTGKATLKDNVGIYNGATFQAKEIVLTNSGKSLTVGEEKYQLANGEWNNGSTGYLEAGKISQNGAAIVIDPEYNEKTSIGAIGALSGTGYSSTSVLGKAGYATGNLIVGKNAALGLGQTEQDKAVSLAFMQEFLKNFQNDQGQLVEDEIGSIAFLGSKLTLANGKHLVVDAHNSIEAINKNLAGTTDGYKYNGQTADLVLGTNTALAVSDNILSEGSAIHFDKANASIYAPKADGQKSGKIVLVGDKFLSGTNITLFQDKDNDGVDVLGKKGENDIRVETLNGLMYFTLEAGQKTTAKQLALDSSKVEGAFLGASEPMRDFLFGYTTKHTNWDEVIAAKDPKAPEYLVDYKAAETEAKWDAQANAITVVDTQSKLTANDYVAIKETVDGQQTTVVYRKANNKFLDRVTQQTNGAAADQAARMGDFGGAAESALVATSTTYDAVAGRFGMGQQAGTMTIANNGQGSGLWVTPVYKSHESDGFDADGLGYGSDITLYGVALGGDVTLANGVRVGAMFNVGSGDADGQGAASVVSNDFDYFGGSIYAGYAIDNLSIVGDISYTTIDSDVEANTAAGKTSTSFDTTTLSVGVTGQYALKVAEMDVTPHAGMRFTRIDMDDYSIDSAEFGEVGQYNASSANVFSIPVGVTISKEYVTDTWTVKPSFDLTLTGNFGDDTVDGTVSWTGVSNYDVSTKAEFVDNFTYGAAVGIAAKTGNFGLGLGLNYTGSSNTDEFGVNANARYMF